MEGYGTCFQEVSEVFHIYVAVFLRVTATCPQNFADCLFNLHVFFLVNLFSKRDSFSYGRHESYVNREGVELVSWNKKVNKQETNEDLWKREHSIRTKKKLWFPTTIEPMMLGPLNWESTVYYKGRDISYLGATGLGQNVLGMIRPQILTPYLRWASSWLSCKIPVLPAPQEQHLNPPYWLWLYDHFGEYTAVETTK